MATPGETGTWQHDKKCSLERTGSESLQNTGLGERVWEIKAIAGLTVAFEPVVVILQKQGTGRSKKNRG